MKLSDTAMVTTNQYLTMAQQDCYRSQKSFPTYSPWARGVVGTILGGKFPHTFSESSELAFYEKVWGPCQQSSLVPEIVS